ncbi:LysR substrate-binding domain-containing protein, partial [Micrococcus sp. SIMBA_131]
IIPNLQSILRAVELGIGVSILPTYLIEESIKEGKSEVLFPHLSVNNTLYAAYRIDQKGDPMLREIVDQG